MPRTVVCGGRDNAFGDFRRALKARGSNEFIAMLIDSEDPVKDIEAPWTHLAARDGWSKPAGANDDQVFLMTTSMETWIVADREALRAHYGSALREKPLVPFDAIESRRRDEVLNSLAKATAGCKSGYSKGDHSFRLLAKLNPEELSKHLPSFRRFIRILNEKL